MPDVKRPRTFLLTTCAVLALSACASGPATVTRLPRPRPLEVAPLLIAFAGRNTATLSPPDESIEALEDARGNARGSDRRTLLRKLAFAHLFAAEESTGDRDAARHRRDASRFAQHAARGGREAYLAAEMAFVDVWGSWRGGARNAGRLSERFTRRHRESGDLFIMAWVIRGEVAYERERWSEAADAYRYLLGLIEHPLYALGLYRTAQCWRNDGRAEEAREALEQVRQMACDAEAPPEIEEIALRATAELRTELRDDPDGHRRPETCPVPTVPTP